MKYLILGLLTFSLSSQVFACGGCSKSSSSQINRNIQSAPGNPMAAGNGKVGKILAAAQTKAAFKDSKVFDSVGKDQGDVNPNWSSSVGE